MRATSSAYTTRHMTQSKRRFNKWIKMRNRHLKKVRHWLALAYLRENHNWRIREGR